MKKHMEELGIAKLAGDEPARKSTADTVVTAPLSRLERQRRAAEHSARGRRPAPRAPRVEIIEDEPEIKAPAAPAVSRRQKILVRIGLLLPFVLLAYTLEQASGQKKDLPDSLMGVWETTADRYADCYMEITPATVIFGTAKKTYLMYYVSSYEQVQAGGRPSYLIHYTDNDGKKYQMTLIYSRNPRETIYFSHQPKIIWTRRPAP